jgi:molecular chaperone GrpE
MSEEEGGSKGGASGGVYDLEPDEALDRNPEELLREAVAAVERAREGEETVSDDAVESEDEAEDLRERLLRTMADFENYRRRSERERGEAAQRALAEPLRAILDVVDNLDRALGAEGSVADMKTGVEMIHRQLGEVLKRFGVEEVVSVGVPFDPTVHEAVMRIEDPEITEQMVTEELQRGFLLKDRLLRPAMVKVAVPAQRVDEGERG